jgi:hypothetical protein
LGEDTIESLGEIDLAVIDSHHQGNLAGHHKQPKWY